MSFCQIFEVALDRKSLITGHIEKCSVQEKKSLGDKRSLILYYSNYEVICLVTGSTLYDHIPRKILKQNYTSITM